MNFFFGGSKDFTRGEKDPAFIDELDTIRKQFGLNHVYIPDQTHGAEGFLVTDNIVTKPVHYDEVESDYVITNLNGVGVGVLTADCLPVLLYSTQQPYVAAVHSGWKGTMQKIVCKAVENLIQLGCTVQSLRAIIGPSAHPCCYEVSQDFVKNIEAAKLDTKYMIYKNNAWYYDNMGQNIDLLMHSGIAQDAINTTQAVCTMCTNGKYRSFRVEKGQLRQASLIWR